MILVFHFILNFILYQKSSGIKQMKIISETEKGWETLWNLKSSDSDGRWVLGQVNITGKSILIVAEKEDGESSGYAAVDDFIEVEDVGKCDVLPEAAAPSPASKYPDCDFETDYCGWTRGDDVDNTTDRFALVRQKGVDIIGDTGPSHDHLFKNSSILSYVDNVFILICCSLLFVVKC